MSTNNGNNGDGNGNDDDGLASLEGGDYGTYRATRQITRPTEVIEPGDEFEPTEAELQAFGEVLEPADGDALARSQRERRPENVNEPDETATPGQVTTSDELAGEDQEAADGQDVSEPEVENPDDTGGGRNADAEAGSDSGDDVSDAGDSFSESELEDASRSDLQSWASDYDDINGNWSNERLRAELTEKAGEDDE